MSNTKLMSESSLPWQYTKGMVVSHVALITLLIKSGVIQLQEVIDELDSHISIYTINYPDSVMLVEPLKLTRDMIAKLFPDRKEIVSDRFTCVADIIGQA